MTPLFIEQEVRQFEELHSRAPWMYPMDLGANRPAWLQLEEQRMLALQQECDRLRLETQAFRSQQEQERQELLLRLQVLEEENKRQREGQERGSTYGTPEGSNKKTRKEAADPTIESLKI